ncbi:hypothetical protein VTP01DRAFT_10609 [Rhizomucor pusillus]|uniref:uncharacterized protein n=1 Tax=Rhizomucor pusillus TaxID=4840 RepID=UPI003742DB6A
MLNSSLASLRTWTSQNRLRHIDHEVQVNLDLSYITARIIAMSYPSDGFESIYRNSLKDVKRFLDARHKGHYKIFNLRSEKVYDVSKFNGPVETYAFGDHQSPPLDMLPIICKDAADWLAKDSMNVVVVHCKAGKGRTGTVIAALLLYLHEAENADHAMRIYGTKRTTDGNGITVPSQIRYVKYFDTLLHNPNTIQRNAYIRIQQIIILSVPRIYKNGGMILFSVYEKDQCIYDQSNKECLLTRERECFKLKTPDMKPIKDDFQVIFFTKNIFMAKRPLCSFWLNTGFIASKTTINLSKADIDEAVKDVDCREFPADFRVVLEYQVVSKGD